MFDIADSMSDGKEELRIELTQQGLALGLNRVNVAGQVRNSFLARRFSVFNADETTCV